MHQPKQREKLEKWDRFKDPPKDPKTGSEVETKYLDFFTKILKIVTITTVFLVVLTGAVISKATTFFMTSQIRKNVTRLYCHKEDRNYQFLVTIPDSERRTWIWFLIFAYFAPHVMVFLKAARKCLFKKWNNPTRTEFFTVLISEISPAIGSAIFIFAIVPELDVIKAGMLTNCVCVIPGILNLFNAKFSQNSKDESCDWSVFALSLIAVMAQATGLVLWPVLEEKSTLFLIPVSLFLISLTWWENFIPQKFLEYNFFKRILSVNKEFETRLYFLYIFITPIKCAIFFITTLLIFYISENDMNFLFHNFYDVFLDHSFKAREISAIFLNNLPYYDTQNITNDYTTEVHTNHMTPIWIFLINILSTYICYVFAKFSCRVMIQKIAFAIPVNLSVPVLISGLIAFCGEFLKDECAFSDVIPPHLFFNLPRLGVLEDFLGQQYSWIWFFWLLSQAWITLHVFQPNCDKLARTEQLFVRPLYEPFLVDQSLALNRRRIEFQEKSPEDSSQNDEDKVTRVYACATMWHEERDEMLNFLKSIFRLDEDQCAHRIARQKEHFTDDYYELETHVFFDDAFKKQTTKVKGTNPLVNKYVKYFTSNIEKAASQVHATDVKIKPPRMYATPYGKRLDWTLPGRTNLIVHLKDSTKIRPKKRWSQVMYMYYLLGFKLWGQEGLCDTRKTVKGEHTYILALDGDIDFKPQALHLLVDLMKKDKGLGAACGRIHPVGSGAIAWYQKFEYAVGHWLQKATEHVIGCVLCSPGCFSLFRASALMDECVMKKYTTEPTTANHYVQYDQGEDRWLCTLLLKTGYRIEYSAASDAYTHCPEGFKEFYNQRRRWMPSTVANILDLLMDSKETMESNENISILYIAYQCILLATTVIGPGTVFLMLIGSLVTVFQFQLLTSLILNLVPILIFILSCLFLKSDVQIFVAVVLTALYSLVMMAVLVGVILQIQVNGVLAPNSLLFFFVLSVFVIAALIHPKECLCIIHGLIYYFTVPSMYMLLVIYSVFNMNDISWGTRSGGNTDEQPDKGDDNNKITLFGDNNHNRSTLEISCNSFFKCMFCTYEDKNIDEPTTKLLVDPSQNQGPVVSVEDSEDSDPDPTQHLELLKLDPKETEFWIEMIKKYLKPIEAHDSKKVLKMLKDLRDSVVFTFMLLNSLFVVCILIFTTKQDLLHLQWFIDHSLTRFIYNSDRDEIIFDTFYLELEPIGFVFVLCFVVLLFVQFLGMLVHRLDTFEHILTHTSLEIGGRGTVENLEQIKGSNNPLKHIKKLQRLNGLNDENENLPQHRDVNRRSTHGALVRFNERRRSIYDLEGAFKARTKNNGESGNADDRKSVKFLVERKETIKRQVQLGRVGSVHGSVGNVRMVNENNSTASTSTV